MNNHLPPFPSSPRSVWIIKFATAYLVVDISFILFGVSMFSAFLSWWTSQRMVKYCPVILYIEIEKRSLPNILKLVIVVLLHGIEPKMRCSVTLGKTKMRHRSESFRSFGQSVDCMLQLIALALVSNLWSMHLKSLLEWAQDIAIGCGQGWYKFWWALDEI
jgi:hypothetical protein